MEKSDQMQKDDDNYKSSTEKKEWWTVTSTVTLLGFLFFVLQFGMRLNLSVAIVAMKDEFEWHEPTQGMVLGSFFYGYLLTNIVGGRAAEYLGGSVIIIGSAVITGILGLLSPIVVRYSTPLFVALRFGQGLSEGVSFPAMNYFLTKWVPKEERPKTGSRIYSGNMVGTFIALPVSGWFSASSLGWPAAFYLFGGLSVILGIVWMWIVSDNPMDHPRISTKELEHITKNCYLEENMEVLPLPWRAILTSAPFWYIVGIHFSINFGLYTLMTELPTYLVEILSFSLTTAGTLAGLTFLAAWVFGLIYGTIVTSVVKKGIMTNTTVRRMSQFISCYGGAVGFFMLLFTDKNPMLAVAVFIFNSTLYGACYSGLLCSHSDLSPRFAGTLYGLTNTVATIPGFAVPLITGILTQDNQTVWAWRWLFIITIIMLIIPATPFILFFSVEVQPWNEPKDTNRYGGGKIVKRGCEILPKFKEKSPVRKNSVDATTYL